MKTIDALFILLVSLGSVAKAQSPPQYAISTFAGSTPQANVPGTSARLGGGLLSVAVDSSAVQCVGTFCYTLAYTGCRISEALALTADRVDIDDGVIVIESLKKRRKGVYRAVPVPPAFLDALDVVHELRAAHLSEDRGRTVHLWSWSRTTAWRHVCEVMQLAGIGGVHATPKGLRHGFGIKAVVSGVPLNLVPRWLGHAQLTTTAIYADAIGPEERLIAQRMWDE